MPALDLPPGGPVPPGTTRVASIGALPRLLQQFRQPLLPLLREAGLPPDLFDDPDRPVALAAAAHLMERAAALTQCPHLGLLCGARYVPETIGLAGHLARNARDIGSALRGLALNLHLNGHAFVVALTVTGGTAEFSLRLAADLAAPSRVAVDVGLAGAFAIMRELCGPRWAPLAVLLVPVPAGSHRPYHRFYGVPVQFGSDRNAILFPAGWLKRPVHGANAAQRAQLERVLAARARSHPLPPALAARRSMLAGLARGTLSVGAVAAMLGVSARTLNRRLADAGTSAADLAREVRYQVARDLLLNTGLTITEVGLTLGYGTLASFTRAFRAWSGASPSDWRRRRRRSRP